ncbi:MAG: choice-of-anchor Q domain-containing protein [bacterium]
MNRKMLFIGRPIGCFSRLLLPGLVFMLVAADRAGAATLYVGAGQTYSTISSAIAAAASSGDIISIETNVQTECGIVINKSLTIQGHGITNTILQGATAAGLAANRIFDKPNGSYNITIRDMTIQYGYLTSGSGAALWIENGNSPNVLLLNCLFASNFVVSASGCGGAIRMESDTGNLTVSNCTFIGNMATNNNAGYGGAINSRRGATSIAGCTFINNLADKAGGAWSASPFWTAASVQNSTFVGNIALKTGGGDGTGGAIQMENSAAVTGFVYNCTIYSNSANSGGGIRSGQNYATHIVNVHSTIIAANTAPGGGADIWNSSTFMATNSLIQSWPVGGTALTGGNNVTGQAAKLSPLAANGGSTLTCVLASDSLAINAGSNPLNLTTDQRGIGYERVIGGTADIGAYEYGALGPASLAYSGTTFAEDPANNGSINTNTPIIITLITNDTFVGTIGDNFATNNAKVLISNIPAGLWPVMTLLSTTQLSVIVTGAAPANTSVDSITNLTFAFQNGAFGRGNAGFVAGATRSDLQVTFKPDTFPRLLDVLSEPAAGAYGLRKLRGAYAGYAIKARRSSDNTTSNIGFTVSGDLDVTTLTNFVGAGNSGYIDTWYDQSGNARNLAQATTAQQRVIVSSGALVVFPGTQRPAHSRGGAGESFTGAINYGATIQAVSSVIYPLSNASLSHNVYDGSSSARPMLWIDTANNLEFDAGDFRSGSVLNTGVVTTYVNPSSSSNRAAYSTGNLIGTPSATKYSNSSEQVAGRGTGSGFNGYYSEIILFTSDIATNSDRQKLEGDEALYFGLTNSLPAGHPYKTQAPVPLPTVLYSTRTFTEANPFNTGAINNTTPMLITLTLNTFTGTDGSQITNNVVVSNLPAGLTVSMVRTNGGTNAVVTLLGNATQNAASNTLANLGFSFQNAAFTIGSAAQIIDASVTNLTVQFYDPVASGALTYAGTNFQEDATWNDGRISTTNTITLTGDTFNSPGGGDFVAAGWVTPTSIPVGLTAVVTYVTSSNLNVTLSGRATSHTAANSTNNLGLTFQNAAFNGANASLITSASVTNLSVTFLDPATNVQLLYTNGTVFSESAANDGSIATTLGIVLTNDLFNGTNGENFVATGKVLTNNIPAGLTAVVTRVSLTNLTATLTGNALLHSSPNNASNLTFNFQNSAFHNTAASAVTNANRSDLSVQFINPVLTYVGTGLAESWRNDGTFSDSTPVLVNLVGDTFAGALGGNLAGAGVIFANVPSGLTGVATKTAAQQVSLTFSGQAVAHSSANNTNFTVSFGNAAFVNTAASFVTNSGPTNLTVTFVNALSNLYVATAANGGSDSNDGSQAHPFATLTNALAHARDGFNDTINVGTGVFTQCGITVAKGVTIHGAGVDATIIQGATTRSNATDRVFNLNGNSVRPNFGLNNLTVRYGYTSGDGAGLQIDYNSSSYWSTYVENCTFTMNDLNGGGDGGGAIVQNRYPGLLFVRNCTFTNNTSPKAGGAIYMRGMGGMEISGCAFAQNQAASGGGGLYMDYATSGMTTIKNSTFANNSTPNNSGGGIYFGGRSAFTGVVYNCTFYSNSATYGGGIFIENDIGTPSTIQLSSCLLASNSAPTAPELYIRLNALTTLSACLAQGGIGGTGTYADGGGNQIGVNAKVLPLAANGGPTLTCALAPDSPARDTGANPLFLTTDQRGTGYGRVRGSAADVGAYEYGAGSLIYSTNWFGESFPFDAGIINNSSNLVITLTGDTFTGTDGSQITNNVVVTNLPAGLTVSMIRSNNGTTALVTLLGNATQHAASNTVYNFGFAFQNAAFTLGNASQIGNYSDTNLTIQFYDQVTSGNLAYSGTNFQEDATWNDGRISTTNTITLTGDTFNSPGGGDFVAAGWVTPTNIPVGLTAVVTYVNSGTCTVTLAGQATSHAAASSTNNLGLAFSNAAFFGNNASLIANASVTNLSVTFIDPATNVQLLYGGTVFSEAAANDGSISNSISITLTNDLFNGTNGENFVATGKVHTNNIPAGLTAAITRVNITNLTATLTGNALLHNTSDNVVNLTFTFQDSAFHNTAASAITNANRSDLSVQFINPVLTYAGSFVESWRNDGSFSDSTPVVVTLAGDSFTGAIGANLLGSGVTVTKVPAGLTAVATKTAAQTVSLTFSGTALANEAANSTNVTVSFGDLAFTRGPASVVTNSGATNIAVTFVSALSNLYVATVANGGSDMTGNGSLANPYATITNALAHARDGYGDTINVGPGIFTECGITVDRGVIIHGAGQNVTIVQGAATRSSAADRVFNLRGGGGGSIGKNFSINNLTVRYGYTTNSGAGLQVDNGSNPYWNTYLENCTFTMNDQNGGSGSGGAIQVNKFPSVTHLRNCTITSNTTSHAGGGLYVRGSAGLEISGCTFGWNSASNTAGTGGGAIYIDNIGGGMATIENSTYAYNQALGSTKGGALYFYLGSSCTAEVYNCTVYSNSASYQGGGIYIDNSVTPGRVLVTSSLVAPNSAPSGGAEIYVVSAAPAVISQCLVQGAIAGTYTDGGGNQMGVNAKVLPLADNGGPTWTCALAVDSPARETGSNPLNLTTDQRGAGYTRQIGAGVDIGAFEYGAGPVGSVYKVR